MDLGDLVPVGVSFVVVALVLSFGLNIVGDIGGDFLGTPNCGQNATGGTTGIVYSSCGYDYNSTLSGGEALDNVSAKLPLIGLVIAAAVIIGVLLKAFQQ